MSSKKISSDTINSVNAAFDSILHSDVNVPNEFKKTLNFQGKKSHLVAEKIITSLTNTTDVIYDPFFGSGAFIIAASNSNRKIVGTELDNYTFNSFIMLLTNIDFKKLSLLFDKIQDNCKDKIMELYLTKCCNVSNYISKLHFDPLTKEYFNPQTHRDIKNGCNIKLVYKCPICQRKDKKFDEFDNKQLLKVETLCTKNFPNHKLIENSRINITAATGANRYDTNFSNRNKYALLLLQEEISKIQDCNEKKVLQFALVYSLALSKISMYGSGTDNLYHVIQYKAQDMNVWMLFEEKLKNIIKYKKRYSTVQKDDFSNTSSISLFNCDYKKYLNEHNSIFDMIYTDPPYTDQCPYLEKSQYFRDWLKIFYNSNYILTDEMLENEIVVSNAPSRNNKNFDNYYQDIDTMFEYFSKHIKDNGFVVLTLKLGEAKYFTTFIKFIDFARKHGFEFVSKFSLDVTDPTIRKQAAFSSTMSTQIIVVFQKLAKNLQYWYINGINFDKFVTKNVYEIIKNQPFNISMGELLGQIKQLTITKIGHSLSDTELLRLQTLIKDYFYVDNYMNISLNPNELYIGLEDQNTLFTKLYDLVPILIKKYLKLNGHLTLDDIYYEIALILCDDSKLFESFQKNNDSKNIILNIINNYCIVSNNAFVERKPDNIVNENSIDISMLDGYEFEELMKKLLSAKGFKDVVRIGGAGDRGVDLIARDINNPNKKVLFQCKRWAANVDSTPIQRLHSMKTIYGDQISRAICITTSNYTKEAKDVSNLTGVELINGLKVITDLNILFPGQYYHGALNLSS